MPIYDYVCSNCGQTTEVIHGIDAPAPRFCPACGAEGTLRKAFAAPAVVFKGSGWAKKDRSSSGAARAKSDTQKSPPSDSGDGTGKGSGSGASTGKGDAAGAAKSSSSGSSSTSSED
jgi:putative FmdB family regulatory protein